MILVTAATGHVGKELVPGLLQAGQSVRVLVRDASKVADLDARVERCLGDLNDPDSLAHAMQGVDKVFLVTFDTQQELNALDAARSARVSQIVKLSTLEATEHKIKVGQWHYEREELIRNSGLAWTFLRPGMFMSNAMDWWAASIKQQGAVYFPGGKGRVAPISPGDVAAVACQSLIRDEHLNQIYELTGSELLTMKEMVAVIGKALGRRLIYRNIPPLAARFWMLRSGMDKTLVDALMQMLASLRKNEGAIVTDAVQRITGRPPEAFEAWCCKHADAFRS